MTDQGLARAEQQGRVVFVCGAVTGVCLGLVSGHAFLWSRAAPDSPATTANATTDWPSEPSPLSSHSFPPSATWTSPYFGGSTPPWELPPDGVSPIQTPIRITTEIAGNVVEPDALPAPPHAEPIDEQTRYRDELTRSIIAEELPHATPQEQDVWFDVLRGLGVADVKGILRMRKNVHGEPDAVATPAPLLTPFDTNEFELTRPSATSPKVSCLTSPALARIRKVRLHNLANAGAIGVPLLEPVISDVFEEGQPEGIQLLRLDCDLSRGEFRSTGRPLDIAIIGSGFFRVTHAGEVRLTRSGRLTLDDERRLVLATTSDLWCLDPVVTIPVAARSVSIQPDGRVRSTNAAAQETDLGQIILMTVLDTAGLKYVGEGLFETTTHSGPAQPMMSGAEVRQFGVERLSSEALEREKDALDRELQLLNQLTNEPVEGRP